MARTERTQTISLDSAIGACAQRRGPIAIALCETGGLAQATLNHLAKIGFRTTIAMGPGVAALDPGGGAFLVDEPILDPKRRRRALNKLIEGLAGKWILICFNGDFAFFPFSETRSVKDLVEFQESERRRAVMSYSIDLYSESMRDGGEPDLTDAFFDAEGWYGFERGDRQADVYGGLGWRYEEYIPLALSRINRPALFMAQKGVTIGDDLWFDDDEMNTVSCPWHNNPTIALMSFRRARVLLNHPKFSGGVGALKWGKSAKFEWRSDQLVELGLIEAGQWM